MTYVTPSRAAKCDCGRSAGAGKRLLGDALASCDVYGSSETDRWTLRDLEAARNLYETNDFELIEEYKGDQWGRAITEQRFRRLKPA
ncbi:MAG: hypothetical protein JJ855_02710 [Rhodospirillales bacterium]|nr:hypothetical protein [Rhodospirillales bacterium]